MTSAIIVDHGNPPPGRGESNRITAPRTKDTIPPIVSKP